MSGEWCIFQNYSLFIECTLQINSELTSSVDRVHSYTSSNLSEHRTNIAQHSILRKDDLKHGEENQTELLLTTDEQDEHNDESEMPQLNKTTQFRVEKLVTFSGKSIYLLHFENFKNKETSLMRLIVQIINFYMSNNLV